MADETMKQPKGLYLLFMVEVWERFNYYGMRAILVLYMMGVLALGTERSGKIYGLFTGFAYLTPLLGGYLADRYLGQRKCMFIGMSLMALGQFILAGSSSIALFYTGLVLIGLGGGIFKPNMQMSVGGLYPDRNDPRRDGGFTINYMAVNVGAFFSPLICGYLGEKVGFKYGFLAAGIGMIIGILTLAWGQKKFLGEVGLHPVHKRKDIPKEHLDAPLTKEEKQRIGVIFIMVFFTIFFWTAFEQAGSSLTLFANNETNRVIFGWEMPASYFQSINPLFIVIFGAIFSKMWVALAKKNLNPRTPVKFVFGLVLLGFGFIIMAVGAKFAQAGPVSMMWLTMAYLFHTLGELCLSPVGTSMVAKLAPAKFASLLMGCWFLSSAAANTLAGFFASNYDSMSHVKFFMMPALAAIGGGLILFALSKKISKLMHGIH